MNANETASNLDQLHRRRSNHLQSLSATAPSVPNQESVASRLDVAFIWLPGNHDAAASVIQAFRQADKILVDVDDPLIPELALPAVVRALQLAQVSAVSARSELHPVILDAVKKIAGNGWIEGLRSRA